MEGEEEEVVVVFTRENRGGSAQEEEEEDVFIRDSITNEDPPNAYQAQHRPKPRMRWVHNLSTYLIYSGAVVLEEEEEAVFIRGGGGGGGFL